MAIERFKTRAKRCIDCKESYFEQKIFKIFSLCVVLYDFCLKTYGPHYVWFLLRDYYCEQPLWNPTDRRLVI